MVNNEKSVLTIPELLDKLRDSHRPDIEIRSLLPLYPVCMWISNSLDCFICKVADGNDDGG